MAMDVGPPPPDAALAGALEVLPPQERLRLGAFRLFSRLLWAPPEAALFEALREAQVLPALARLARDTVPGAAAALQDFAAWLERAGPDELEAARRDFLGLFVAARRQPAPPWESVYTSADRLVNQDAARRVLRAYAEARLGFEGMRQVPADHVALELGFAAALLAEGAHSDDARRRLTAFESAHMAPWMPRWCLDLQGAAATPPYRAVALALPAMLTSGAAA